MKETGNQRPGAFIARGIGFLLIALGLIYCLLSGEVIDGGMKAIVYLVVAVSFILGVHMIVNGLRSKTSDE